MAGIFDRLKDRFTQYAAGTADTSALSEEQAKLLRRQAIGRLGASLYRDGDFGAGMEAQAKVNADRLAQEQERLMREQAQGLWQGLGGTGPQQAPQLNPEQQRIMQTPRLLANPQTQVQQASIASQQAQAPQQPTSPTPDMRAALQQRIALAQSQGRDDVAEAMLEYAKQFAPLEEWFAPTEYTDPATGQTRLGQFSKLGNQRLTDVQAAEPDSAQIVRIGMRDPAFQAARLADRAAGATRLSVSNVPANVWDREFAKGDAGNYQTIQAEGVSAVQSLRALDALQPILQRNPTGVIPGLIAQAGRLVGTEVGTDLEAAEALIVPRVAAMASAFGTGNGFTDKDREFLVNAQPGFFKTPEGNAILFRFLRAQELARVQRAQSAREHRAQFGNTLDWQDPAATYQPYQLQDPASPGAAGAGGVPPIGTPEFDAWMRAKQNARLNGGR
ncbi:MAG: hypothetical protein ACK5NX_01240 [Armatimonadota bacterium]